jgi:wyosine [tRNA(Phe)-imidazoG37] synthetase (radical SAM superfamily)
MKFLFGPVPSRRLGRSLGIDLVTHKSCGFDCVYCELGPTTNKTVRRRRFVDPGDVLKEVHEYLRHGPPIDYVTFSGSGEPTLSTDIGTLIHNIKQHYSYPIAVLTNSSLLGQPDVQEDLRQVDVVIASLDAGTDEIFERINQPHPALRLQEIIDGLIAFRQQFSGQLWLEILFCKDINDSPEHVKALAGIAARIQPHKVQLGTVFRPPADPAVMPVSAEFLQEIAPQFGPAVEIVASFRPATVQDLSEGAREKILAMLQRRPCTLKETSQALGLSRDEVGQWIDVLESEGALERVYFSDEIYYQARKTST